MIDWGRGWGVGGGGWAGKTKTPPSGNEKRKRGKRTTGRRDQIKETGQPLPRMPPRARNRQSGQSSPVSSNGLSCQFRMTKLDPVGGVQSRWRQKGGGVNGPCDLPARSAEELKEKMKKGKVKENSALILKHAIGLLPPIEQSYHPHSAMALQ